MTEPDRDGGSPGDSETAGRDKPNTGPRVRSPAAERALAEAAARRAEIDRRAAERPEEARGPKGLEPTRYGDWERKGIASDF